MSARANGANGTAAGAAFRVEIATKLGLSDAAGAWVAAQFGALGLATPLEVRVCPIYEITGRLTPHQVEFAARELLADPITQEYRIGDTGLSPAFMLGPHWRVEVWLKPSVTDPVSASVAKGLADLGLPAPERVRCGTAYKIAGRLPSAHVERAARKILSNPVIHQVALTSPAGK